MVISSLTTLLKQKLRANLRPLITVLTVVLIFQNGQAYEADTHFDLMYHLCRASGLNDGTSKLLALANQHIDEGIVSSAMLLSVQRQLFHFPGSITKVDIEGHGVISLPARIFKSKLALAERNSAIGNYLIYLGLSKGDLLLIGLGMHVKMDTYGHAGHSNLLGHMEVGHNPDRAFLETKKYEDMIRSMVQSIVAVRQLLPEEALDEAAALKYLNRFAKGSHLKRDLTVADLQDATTVSGIFLKDNEFQNIYRENMFRKYEYKKLALEKIYEKFSKTGEIKPDITFNDIFPEDIIRDHRLTVKDVIRYAIVTRSDAEFLKSEGGKETFNLQKLFGYQSEELFKQKFNLEVKRSEFRLRELFNSTTELKDLSEKYKVDLAVWEKLLEDFHAQNIESRNRGEKLKYTDPVEYLANRFSLKNTQIRSIYYLNLRIQSEAEELLKGIGPSSYFEEGSEDFMKARAIELAENRNAEEIAIKLTKDLIPGERSEYVKQNFEGNPDTRKFEKEYKATAYRLHRIKNWSVNFTKKDETAGGLIAKFRRAAAKFKSFITQTATPQKIEHWSELAQTAAVKYMDFSVEQAELQKAEFIKLNKALKFQAFLRLGTYLVPALIPWFVGKLMFGASTGYVYIQRLVKKAQLHAKDHEVEDMKQAASEGKYKENLFNEKKSQKAVQFIHDMNRSSKMSCDALFLN